MRVNLRHWLNDKRHEDSGAVSTEIDDRGGFYRPSSGGMTGLEINFTIRDCYRQITLELGIWPKNKADALEQLRERRNKINSFRIHLNAIETAFRVYEKRLDKEEA